MLNDYLDMADAIELLTWSWSSGDREECHALSSSEELLTYK